MTTLARRAIRVLALLPLAAAAAAHAQIDPELLAGMRARSIGPAGMSGRTAAVAAVPDDPNVIYVGAASGGLWKSIDAGVTWKPLFDDQPVASIGAIAIHPKIADHVWVGTGEGNPRNSASVGDGIFRSRDGGRTWAFLGLAGTERIHRVVLHPDDPDVAYAAAMGTTWGESAERGVYKTTDGGATWDKVLYVDERTGASDLIMDPSNPDKLFAGMWEHRRHPYFFKSGGPGSGLYVTHDGGATWTKRGADDGLPGGDLGRIGLALCRAFPDVVYAGVEAAKNSVCRSDDGGATWRVVNDSAGVLSRPFYYCDLRVDPEWPHRVYNLGSTTTVSNDGGRSFQELTGWVVHPDHHGLWINPRDPSHLINTNDGGVAISRDRGKTFRFVRNLPFAQFYHVRVDMDEPYNVYGGLQDNGSWRGPSSVWENGGIRNHHWQEVNFGDGFDTVPDPEDSMTGYAMAQGGALVRWDLRTGMRHSIRPPAPDADTELRFNWNAAIALDPFDPAAVYYGSQFVHKSPDRGASWEIISPDLTSDNAEWQKQQDSGGLTIDVTGAENFTSLVAIAPSAIEEGVIWTGSDDGRIHVTRDGGETWTSVEKNVPGVPAHTWVPHIEPSHHDAATAFVVFDDHRRANWTTYVYKTTNYGKTWVRLATSDLRGYALVIAQDPVDADLLFVGTEFGLFVTLDGGKQWFQWTHGFPTTSAMDMVVHPREHDLVVGTHGRGIFILDDVRPLRELSAEVLAEPLHLFEVPPATMYRSRQTDAPRFPGHGEFRGASRPYGAMITYAAAEAGKVDIEILDDDDEVVHTFTHQAKPGVNRMQWRLRRDPFFRSEGGGRGGGGGFRFGGGGVEVLPGAYTVVLKKGDDEARGTVEVHGDPRVDISRAARVAKIGAQRTAAGLSFALREASTRIGEIERDVDFLVGRIKKLRDDEKKKAEDEAKAKAGNEKTTRKKDEKTGDTKGEQADDTSPAGRAITAGEALKKTLAELRKELAGATAERQGINRRGGLSSRVRGLTGSLGGTKAAPTASELEKIELAKTLVDGFLERFGAMIEGELAEFRKAAAKVEISLVPEAEPVAIPDGATGGRR